MCQKEMQNYKAIKAKICFQFRSKNKEMVIWLLCDESKTQKHWYITYELSSFFLNLSTGEQEQNRERK